MDTLIERIVDFLSSSDNPLGLLVLAGAALVEYVFPPFPGDSITLFGAVLITAYGWSFVAVFGAVMLGSVAGAMIAFHFGGRIQARRERRGTGGTYHERIDRLVAKFERHGAWYLVLNRFLPSFRALFFVAAGMARMRWLAVMGYAALSAAAWNLLIIGAGTLIGANLDVMTTWLSRYIAIVWIAVGVGLMVYATVRYLRRRADDGETPPP